MRRGELLVGHTFQYRLPLVDFLIILENLLIILENLQKTQNCNEMLERNLARAPQIVVGPRSRATCRPFVCRAAAATEIPTLAAAKRKKLGDSELLVSRE